METRSGLFGLWDLGLYGSDPGPTLHGRSIDRTGTFTSEVMLLSDELVLHMRAAPYRGGLPDWGLPISAHFRVGSNDSIGILYIDEDGRLDPIRRLGPTGPRNRTTTVWTGERFISAWERGDRVVVQVADEDGVELDRFELDGAFPPNLGAINLGVYDDRVGVLAAVYYDAMFSRGSSGSHCLTGKGSSRGSRGALMSLTPPGRDFLAPRRGGFTCVPNASVSPHYGSA